MEISGQVHADHVAEYPASVVLFQKLNSFFLLAHQIIGFRHKTAEGLFPDLGIRVLYQQRPGALRQLQGAAGLRLALFADAENEVYDGTVKNDLKGVGVFLQRLFRLCQGLRVPVPGIFVQSLLRCLDPVVLHPVAQQRVHGDVEKVCHFHQQPQFRHGLARFPFVDRPGGDAQDLRQLLLGIAPLLPEAADVFCKGQLHAPASFALLPLF